MILGNCLQDYVAIPDLGFGAMGISADSGYGDQGFALRIGIRRPRIPNPESRHVPSDERGLNVAFAAAAGRLALRFELVLDDLAVQGATADIQHARRLFLVPLSRFEYADDVRAFGLGERWQAIS